MSDAASQGARSRNLIVADIVDRTGIDEAMIERLVRTFYGRARRDPLLGPIFDSAVHDWEKHIARLCDFWSSVALMSGRYHGQPMVAHLPLRVDTPHFDRWLELFATTAGETCPPAAAAHFLERAHRIADSLELGIAVQRGEIRPKRQRPASTRARFVRLSGALMPSIDRETSALLLVDFQSRLMPAIEGAGAVLDNARRLVEGARLLGVPLLFTEHNAKGLGPTVPELQAGAADTAPKVTFDACRHPGFLERLPSRRDIVVCGCETHVCVLQTVFGLLRAGRQVFLVRDAVGSRRSESKETAISRMAKNGAELVTTEMVLFEWLATAEDPRFREVLALVR